MGRRGPSEDAHHHVEGEKDLWQTDPDVQGLLVSSKTSDGCEDLVEIHFASRTLVLENRRCKASRITHQIISLALRLFLIYTT